MVVEAGCHEIAGLRNRGHVFKDRFHAGAVVAQMLAPRYGGHKNAMVLAIPAGGVPVGLEISRSLGIAFDLVIVRKLQIPGNTEAGFGAMTMDGSVFYNEDLLRQLHLSRGQIDRESGRVGAELEKRNRIFRKGRPFPDLKGVTAVLVDDGLASGYTMRAASAYLRKRKPGSITLALPTGSADTVQMLRKEKEADAIYCLNIRVSYPYAVASAYCNWYDLEDEDVLQLISKFRDSHASRIR